ncbi:MAG: hypothetical protein J5590_00735 [Clostridia bacterium]|nr:hypothetical protein [Clostridia bacterium]
MKVFRKHLSLLLAVSMLLALFAVSGSITASADPTALLELDFSNFSAQTFHAPNIEESELVGKTSGVTATGTLAASTTLGFAARDDGGTTLTKESFANANGGTTYYIDYYDANVYPNVATGNSYSNHLTDVQFFNSNLEASDNTISFWVDVTASAWFKEILCYRVDYTKANGDTSLRSFDLGINPNGTWNAVCESWAAAAHASAKTDGAFSVPTGWKHVVITNPVRSGNSKTLDVYVNGQFKKSVTLDIPDTATVNHATVSFFGKSDGTNNASQYWRANWYNPPAAQLGGVKVYDGAMSASDVASLYTAQLPEFSEDTGLQTITGYSFSDATVDYDGASHNITVTAAQGATEGISIAYTCNGSAFSGATEVGTYDITATITKDGYQPLVLSATLKIKQVTVQPTAGDLLVDLDFSTYVKDDSQTDPNTVAGSVGEVTNNGLLANTTILKFKSSAMVQNWCHYDLALESFANAAGSTTYYLHKTVGVDYCTDGNRFSTIIEEGLEDQANTISFWANHVPCNRSGAQWNILDYSAEYGGTSNILFSLNQAGTTTNKFVLVGRGETPSYGDITDIAAGKWAHYVVTNPEYTLNTDTGNYEKTMQVFVNGVWKGQKVVTRPSGTLTTAKIALAGEAVNPGSNSGKNWPTDISFGDVKVYAGTMSASEIMAKYNEELPRYNNTPPVQIIEFVNGSDVTIENLDNLPSVTLKYNPESDDLALCFVACYDENGELLAVSCMRTNTEGTITVEIPDGTSVVKGYAWDAATLAPISDCKELTYSEGYDPSDVGVTGNIYDGSGNVIDCLSGKSGINGRVTISSLQPPTGVKAELYLDRNGVKAFTDVRDVTFTNNNANITIPLSGVTPTDGDELVLTVFKGATVYFEKRVPYEDPSKTVDVLFVIGQSNALGQGGNSSESVDPGDGVYYGTMSTKASKNQGWDSALGKTWHEETGHTVLIIKATWGGTGFPTKPNLDDGQTSQYGSSTYGYWNPGNPGSETSMPVDCYTLAKKMYYTGVASIDRSKYTVGNCLYFWNQGENENNSYTPAEYEAAFMELHNAMKTEFSTGMDDTKLTGGGILPVRSSYNRGFPNLKFTGSRVAHYNMAKKNDDIALIMDCTENWYSDASIQSWFSAKYAGKTYPYGTMPSKWSDIMNSDNVHYKQIAMNEIGEEAAKYMLAYLKGTNTATGIDMITENGIRHLSNGDSFTLDANGAIPVIPASVGTKATFTVSGAAASFDANGILKPNAAPSGSYATLTVTPVVGNAMTFKIYSPTVDNTVAIATVKDNKDAIYTLTTDDNFKYTNFF